jgi:hypothetical protein
MSAMRQHEPGPEVVSAVVQQAIEVPHPKSRYLVAVPWSNRLALLLGDSIKDFIFRRMFQVVPSAF